MPPADLLGVGLEDNAAAERLAAPRVAQHEAVVPVEDRRLGQRQEGQPRVARVRGVFEEPEVGVELGGADVDLERPPFRDLVGQVGEEADGGEAAPRRAPQSRQRHHVAPPDRLRFDTDEVERRAVARRDLAQAPVVGLDGADARPDRSRQHLDLLALRQAPAGEGAGHDRAGALHREDPVDPEAGPLPVPCGGGRVQHPVELGLQIVQAGPGRGRDREHGGVAQRRPCDALPHAGHDGLQRLGIDEVRLRDDDDRGRDPEEVEDVQVLLRLRLPALVGRHDEDGGVDGADPRQHVADEPLVTRDVDDPHLPARRQLEPGETQVDGEAPALLLLEAVRVDAGQRLDERALAVVDVTGRRNDVHG